MVEKDENGNFIAADKLIEIAQYYGFDGYIFNAESGTGVAGFKEFLIYLQEHKPDNFTISWYNGSGTVNESSIKSWMQDGDTRITDEWWLDMSGNGNMDSSIHWREPLEHPLHLGVLAHVRQCQGRPLPDSSG